MNLNKSYRKMLGTDDPTTIDDMHNEAIVGVETDMTTIEQAVTAVETDKLDKTEKGTNGGVAELDEHGKIPSNRLPDAIDGIIEYPTLGDFPATGESGKIYFAVDTNKSYRWGGTTYVEISEGVTLGETPATAYRGDRGKEAYDHSQAPHASTNSVLKVNGKDSINNEVTIDTDDIQEGVKKFVSETQKNTIGVATVADIAELMAIPTPVTDKLYRTLDDAQLWLHDGTSWVKTKTGDASQSLRISTEEGLIIDGTQVVSMATRQQHSIATTKESTFVFYFDLRKLVFDKVEASTDKYVEIWGKKRITPTRDYECSLRYGNKDGVQRLSFYVYKSDGGFGSGAYIEMPVNKRELVKIVTTVKHDDAAGNKGDIWIYWDKNNGGSLTEFKRSTGSLDSDICPGAHQDLNEYPEVPAGITATNARVTFGHIDDSSGQNCTAHVTWYGYAQLNRVITQDEVNNIFATNTIPTNGIVEFVPFNKAQYFQDGALDETRIPSTAGFKTRLVGSGKFKMENLSERLADTEDNVTTEQVTVTPADDFQARTSVVAHRAKEWAGNRKFVIGEFNVSHYNGADQSKWNDLLELGIKRFKADGAECVYAFCAASYNDPNMPIAVYAKEGSTFISTPIASTWEKYAAAGAGLNLSSLEVATGTDNNGVFHKDNPKDITWSFLERAHFEFLASKGWKKLRLPFRWERLQPEFNQPFTHNAYSTAYRDKITDYYNWAAEFGMTIMLEPHNYAKYATGESGGNVVETTLSAAGMEDNYHDLLGKLIAQWGTHAAWHKLDLQNEPVGVSNGGNSAHQTTWEGIAQRAITYLEGIGYRGKLSVPLGFYSGAHSASSLHPNGPFANSTLIEIDDQLHFYPNWIGEYGEWDGTFKHAGGAHTTYAEEVATAGAYAGQGTFQTSDTTSTVSDDRIVSTVKNNIPVVTSEEIQTGTDEEKKLANAKELNSAIKKMTAGEEASLPISSLADAFVDDAGASALELTTNLDTTGASAVLVKVSNRQANEIALVTCGGVTMQKVATKVNAEVCGVSIYALFGTFTGSKEIKVTYPTTSRFFSVTAVAFSNVEKIGAKMEREGWGTDAKDDVAVTNDSSMVFGALEVKTDMNVTPIAGETELHSSDHAAAEAGRQSTGYKLASATTPFGWTLDTGENWAIAAVELVAKKLDAKSTQKEIGHKLALGTHGTFQSANRSWLIEARLENKLSITKVAGVIYTSDGNMDIGVYGEDGKLRASTGSFPCPAVGVFEQNLATPIELPAGNYYIAVASDSATAELRTAGTVILNGGYYKNSNFPLTDLAGVTSAETFSTSRAFAIIAK